MDYARYGYAFPASYIKTQRETLRRLLMAYLEGIYVFRTRPKAVYSALEEEDIKDPVSAKGRLRTRAQERARISRAGTERHSERA